MKKLLLIACCLLSLTALAQDKSEGVVTYEHATDWVKMNSQLTFLSKEEKERMAQTWKNDEVYKTKMKLAFSPTQSLYTYLSDQGQSEDGTYSWRQDDYIIQRDFEKEKKTEIIEMLGRTYILEDSLQTPKWKVLNQLKDIAGYVCMKAEAKDPLKGHKLTAWFSSDILVPAGPEQSYGLPGLIMELDLNDGAVVITATKVEFKDAKKDLALPAKLKGKKIKNSDYNKLISEHIRDSMKAHRNPFWAIRY
ncbi:GLPGLI family protein [Tellurirhabdus bombi]|uniref:GLPGLI family protein n=1 Tax=Tellurirhabdus bombi TaxID=2907205 RepID=UPI001F1DA7F6|nr:GLPGLI family protein [Tellurirhabdus bombi]